MSTRKNRVDLGLSKRIEVLNELKLDGRKRRNTKVKELAAKYNVCPRQIYNILDQREKILKKYAEFMVKRKTPKQKFVNNDVRVEAARIREEKINFLRKVLHEYLQRIVYYNYSVDKEKVRQKALEIKECIDIDNLQLNNGWFDRFKVAYGITAFDREALHNNVQVAEKKKSELSAINLIKHVTREEKKARKFAVNGRKRNEESVPKSKSIIVKDKSKQNKILLKQRPASQTTTFHDQVVEEFNKPKPKPKTLEMYSQYPVQKRKRSDSPITDIDSPERSFQNSGIFNIDATGRRDKKAIACGSNRDDYIYKTASVTTNFDTSNLPAIKIEILEPQLMEYHGLQPIRLKVLEDTSVDKTVSNFDNKSLQESDKSKSEILGEEKKMKTIYLKSDNEEAEKSTRHKENERDSKSNNDVSIKIEPDICDEDDGNEISCKSETIKTEPQLFEKEYMEWNALKTDFQAIKDMESGMLPVENIKIKTELHMLENDAITEIKTEIITHENDESEKRSYEQGKFMENQNSSDSYSTLGSVVNASIETSENKEGIILFCECSETIKMENVIEYKRQIPSSSSKRSTAEEACKKEYLADDIPTPKEAQQLLEMLQIYAATTENLRAIIVLSQLEEALKEEPS